MPVVTLLEYEQECLGLILPRRTGIFWSNQTGGTGCNQPQVEGIYLPLPHWWLPETDPLKEQGPSFDPEKVRSFLKASDYLVTVFWPLTEEEMRANDARVQEAWVPVRIRDDVDICLALESFRGQMGILTYPNSA